VTIDFTKSKEKTSQERRWPPRQGEWTYDDYARLPDNGMRYEVIEGDLYMSPAPRPKHQLVSGKLVYAFHQFLREHDLGQIYHAPVDVNMPGLTSPVQPDLLFISHKNMDIITEKRIDGVPDLIIEILSPGNPMHDRDTKFHVYARAGVNEYWIIDPDTCIVDVFVLRGQAYAPLGNFGENDKVQSELLPDLILTVSEICTT